MTVYFILAPEVNRIKIGYTTNLEKRLDYLQTHSPCTLKLLHYIEYASIMVERKLHKRFAELHHHGEWFEFRGSLKTFVANLQLGETKCFISFDIKPQIDTNWVIYVMQKTMLPTIGSNRETWLPIPIAPFSERYHISNRGRVLSHHFNRILAGYRKARDGNIQVQLHSGGYKKAFYIAELVLLTFGNISPEQARNFYHANGDESDNRIDNLRWAGGYSQYDK